MCRESVVVSSNHLGHGLGATVAKEIVDNVEFGELGGTLVHEDVGQSLGSLLVYTIVVHHDDLQLGLSREEV